MISFYFIWVLFLASKNEAFSAFSKFCRKNSNKKKLPIISIRSDHGTKFENKDFKKFYDKKNIDHNFLALTTP